MKEMPTLYEQVNGDILKGYLLLKSGGSNVPPAWIDRYYGSRKKLEKEVARILKKSDLNGIMTLEDWNHKLKMENFYRGIRALMEMERKGKTDY